MASVSKTYSVKITTSLDSRGVKKGADEVEKTLSASERRIIRQFEQMQKVFDSANMRKVIAESSRVEAAFARLPQGADRASRDATRVMERAGREQVRFFERDEGQRLRVASQTERERTRLVEQTGKAMQRAHAAGLKDVQRNDRAITQSAQSAARKSAQSYEKELGKGFFSKLGKQATDGFKQSFSLQGGDFSGNGLSGILSGALSVAGGGALTSLVSGIAGKVTGAVKTGFDFNRIKEQSLLNFELKLKGKDEALRFFDEIAEFVEKTPLELEQGLEGVNRLMTAFDSKQALQSLKAITDTVVAQGKVGGEAAEQINGIGLQLQQMWLKGKVSATETTSLAERQVKVFKYLGDELARTDKGFAALTDEQRISRVLELAEKGLLNARTAVATIIKGMEAEFGGTAEQFANKTLGGIESNIADRQSRLAGRGTENAFEATKRAKQSYLGALNSPYGDRVAGEINSTVGDVLNSARDVLEKFNIGILSNTDAVKQTGADIGNAAAEGIHAGGMSGIQMMINDMSATAKAAWQDAMDVKKAGGDWTKRGKSDRERAIEAIEREAERTGVPAELLRAQMNQESGFKRYALSHKGAAGVAQFVPDTARAYGLKVNRQVDERYDIEKSIRAMADHMADLIRINKGSIPLALAAYNAGQGAVNKYGGIPPYAETKDYVSKITAAMRGGDALLVRVVGGDGAYSQPFNGRQVVPGADSRVDYQIKYDKGRDGKWHEVFDVPVTRVKTGDLERQRDELSARLQAQIARNEQFIRDLGASLPGVNLLDLTQQEITNFRAWWESEQAELARMKPSLDVAAAHGNSRRFPRREPEGFMPEADPLARHQERLRQMREGVIEVSTEVQRLGTEIVPLALEAIPLPAQKAAEAFANLPPLIKATSNEAEEAQKQFEQFAETLAGIGGDFLQNIFTNPREALKSLRNDFLGMLVGMGRDLFQSSVYKWLMGGASSGSSSGRSASSGGFSFGNILSSIFGGGKGSTSALTPGFTGGNPAAAMLGGGFNFASPSSGVTNNAALNSNFGNLLGDRISAPRSVTEQAIAAATRPRFVGAGTAAPGQSKGILSQLLGGFQSPTGGLSAGGGAAALGLNVAIYNALFGRNAAAALGGGRVGQLLGPIAANPFLVGLPIFGLLQIFGRSKIRRKEEQQRTQIINDSLGQLQQILKDVKADRLDGAQAVLQATQIRGAYLEQVGQLKDSKTRRIAEKDVSRLDLVAAQIRQASDLQTARKEVAVNLVPTFANGGRVFGALTRAEMHEASFMRKFADGGAMARFVGRVPGLYDRRDDKLIAVSGDETVITPAHRTLLGGDAAMRDAGVPGYESGIARTDGSRVVTSAAPAGTTVRSIEPDDIQVSVAISADALAGMIARTVIRVGAQEIVKTVLVHVETEGPTTGLSGALKRKQNG